MKCRRPRPSLNIRRSMLDVRCSSVASMFENTVLLAGLGGAVVPLVIHLLGRARYRSIEWGAMMFIDAAAPRFRDPGRLREWTLLAVRMAAVALLAVALARPMVEPASAMPTGAGGISSGDPR